MNDLQDFLQLTFELLDAGIQLKIEIEISSGLM